MDSQPADFVDSRRHLEPNHLAGAGQTLLAVGLPVTISQDTTGFHSYRIEATPGAPTYDFFIDSILRGSATPTAVAVNRVILGDLTGAANAQADITSFTFSQTPEPSSTLLLGFGALLMVLRHR